MNFRSTYPPKRRGHVRHVAKALVEVRDELLAKEGTLVDNQRPDVSWVVAGVLAEVVDEPASAHPRGSHVVPMLLRAEPRRG